MTVIHITEERLLELVDMKADELFAAIDEIKADPIQRNWIDADCIEALEAKLKKAVAALELYSCDDGCNECPESERDRVSCGWIARAALASIKETDNG